MSSNVFNCKLFETEVELLGYHLTTKLSKDELTKLLDLTLISREQTARAMDKAYMNICKLTMMEILPSRNNAHLLNLICRQIVSNADRILEDFHEANMMFWKVYEHVLNVKDKIKEVKQNLTKYISDQGAYLADNLFSARERCFWAQDYVDVCYPGEVKTKRLSKEQVYRTIVMDKVKYHRDELTNMVSGINSLHEVLKSNGLADKIKRKDFNISDSSITQDQKELIERFKPIAVNIVWRRINSVVARYREFMQNKPASGLAKTTCPNEEITKRIYLDLAPAFNRCAKKYFYCACLIVNPNSVSFKCYNSPNDDMKQNVTYYSHKCQMQYYQSTKTSTDDIMNFKTDYEGGKLTVIEGAIYPWMLGDGTDLMAIARKRGKNLTKYE
jgi:hypothetical protein